MTETILIVDDEEPVRRTFFEWIEGSGWDVRILSAADPEQALKHANNSAIDLAILDWNLGTGTDGLQLLEDLSVFQPDLVAILVTGFAHQATPLAALRMGVRDYLDKNQDLTRESFLKAVRKQLDRIVPIKQQRDLHRGLAEFRTSVERILPLVQQSAAWNDPVPLPQAAGALCRFLQKLSQAADAVLLVRHFSDTEWQRAYAANGDVLADELVPFSKSLAASAASLGEPCILENLASVQGALLQPFERPHQSLLAVPFTVGGGVSVVLELFDKPGGFTTADRATASSAVEIGAELVKQAIAERHVQMTLFDAIQAALGATAAIETQPTTLPAAVRDSLERNVGAVNLELAEAIRELGERHGDKAIRHCTQLMRSLLDLLND